MSTKQDQQPFPAKQAWGPDYTRSHPSPWQAEPQAEQDAQGCCQDSRARHVVGWESHQAPLSGHPGGERPSPLRSESSGPPTDEEPIDRRISPNSAHTALPLPRPPCLLLTTILACDSLSTHHTVLKKAPDCGSGAGHRPASPARQGLVPATSPRLAHSGAEVTSAPERVTRTLCRNRFPTC